MEINSVIYPAKNDPSERPGQPSPTEVTLSAGLPGMLTVQASQQLPLQPYFNTFKYNRELSQVVKMHGQVDGITAEFSSGRDLLNS